MKLISCYIENFGGLSQYALDFSDGVTLLEAPNGFGKTTLAEFLRAMFYGFPRKAKTLEKSKRQKYTPWNGGKFGGNLIFEAEGQLYRLERTFGATPKGDSFQLIDLATGRKSSRFSEEIGLELFQLDADSFERSTYLPQNQDDLTLTTAGIQAKLTDLVEDTNDLGNFDKAISSLKTARSAFVPYRGSGGSVAEAAGQVTSLQQQIAQLRLDQDALAHSQQELARLEGERQDCESRMNELQGQISAAAETALRQEKRKQLLDMETRHAGETAAIAALRQKYPNGLPQPEAIEDARKTADTLAALTAREITSPSDLEAEEVLKELSPRFVSGVPTAPQLEEATRLWETAQTLQTEGRGIGLTGSEEAQYDALHARFAGDPLTEEALDALAEQNRLLLTHQAALDSLTTTEEDRAKMGRLTRVFAGGLPQEADIARQEETLARCRSLEQDAPVKKPDKTGILLSILAGVLAAVAVHLLLLVQYLYGGITLAAALVLGATFLVRRRKIIRARDLHLRQHQEQLQAWQEDVDNFIQNYIPGGSGEAGLREIRQNLAEYEALAEQLRQLKQKRAALEDQLFQERTALNRALESYVCQGMDPDRAISQLRLDRSQYLALAEKRETAARQRDDLAGQIRQLCDKLDAFLAPYGIHPNREQLGAAIGRLKQDTERYLRAKAQTERHNQQKQALEAQTAQLREALAAFLAPYGMTPAADIHQQLLQLRDDGRALDHHVENQSQLRAAIGKFLLDNPGIDAQSPEAPWNTEDLQQQSKLLTEELFRVTREISRQEQNLRSLQAQIDTLPRIQDELESWQEKRMADQKKARILDDTMAFLQSARDQLTTGYLGPIRASFTRYLEKMTRQTGETVIITPELEVQLERLGQARELGYFSAGQTDTIMLCMRLALVDALFREEAPFVILDDPFVNLDDERTAQALELLKELGKERQIIYMTCNSSRSM